MANVSTQSGVAAGISVGEIAEVVEGQIVLLPEKASAVVENLMLGAISPESAVNYFRRKGNKAVIAAGDRPDIQLAALETPTTCLVIADGAEPRPMVLGRAEDQGVAVIVTKMGTVAAAEKIGAAFGAKK